MIQFCQRAWTLTLSCNSSQVLT